MRMKKSFKYQFHEVWQSIGLIYLVQIGMRLLAVFIAAKVGADHVTMNGMNVMTMMFMLVLGMCTFTESFQFLVQNGVSRKHILAGKLLCFAAGAGMCGVADALLSVGDQKLREWGLTKFGGEILPLFYQEFLDRLPYAMNILISAAVLSVVYALVAGVGYAVAIIWYRLNKTGRIALVLGVPVVQFVYPIADYFLFDGKSMSAIANTILKLSGIADGNPIYGLLSGIAGLVILAGFSALLIKRTMIRREN